ncbi:hypothetical protein DSECCO2_447560 [anaerobic digester metagenome]
MVSGSTVEVVPAVFTFILSTSPLPVTLVPVSRFSVSTTAPVRTETVDPLAASSTVREWTEPLATVTVELGETVTTSFRFPATESVVPASPSTLMLVKP